MAIRQARESHQRGRHGADRLECVDHPRDGLDFARGVLLAVVLSVPLWSIIVAVILLVLSAR